MIDNEKQFLLSWGTAARVEQEILRLQRTNHDGLIEYNEAQEQLVSLDDELFLLRTEQASYETRMGNDLRKGRWMPMYSGNRIWPQDPRPNEIQIEDIAHNLSNINRFNGQTKRPYSVAQHSVLVSRLLPQELKLFGLLHDAGETYVGDCVSPIKVLIQDIFSPIEDGIMSAVADRFWFADQLLDQSAIDAVKKADNILLATEVRDLTTSGFIVLPLTEIPMANQIAAWGPEKAEKTNNRKPTPSSLYMAAVG